MNLALSAIAGKRPAPLETQSDDRSSSSTEEVLDLQGDQFGDNKEELAQLNLSYYDMWALGLTTAIGGHFFAWNEGLVIGFGGFLVALFLISTAFLSLVLCMAELSSALPFAGGAYGIARVTLGIFPGYLVAICDSYKSVIYVSIAVYSAADILTTVFQSHQDLEYLYWALLFLVYLSVLTYGGRFFWQINFGLAAVSFTILVMYIFGSIPFVDFEKNAAFPGEKGVSRWFQGDMSDFLSVLPIASRFFRGIQSINLACGQIKDPKTEVPKGYMGAMTTVVCTAFCVFFLACSIPPGIIEFAARPRPLTSGFRIMFALPRSRAIIFSLPATLMSGFGFMYYYGQQLSAMGNSGLINPCFGWELPRRLSPVVALFSGTIVAYMLCVIQWHYPNTENQIYALSILGSSATYVSIFASFIMFRNYYPTIKREFVSPLGTFGAVYGMLVFSLCFISICGFQEDQVAIIVFGCIMVVASVYYYFVVRKRQTFSKEEKTVMFKAYLVKNNAAKAVRIRRGHAGAQAVGQGQGGQAISTASAGSGSVSNASSATGICAGSRSKNSFRQVARINVEPAPRSDSNTAQTQSNSEGTSRQGDLTPTSTTIPIPYHAPEQQTLVRTPRAPGSRRGSENVIEAPPPALVVESPERASEVQLAEAAAPSVSAEKSETGKSSGSIVEQSTPLSFDTIYPGESESENIGTKGNPKM